MSQDTPNKTTLSASIVWNEATRAAQFQIWLDHIAASYKLQPDSLRLASADASFRRYFRIDSFSRTGDKGQGPISCIIMDAPPDKENCQPFVHVAALMQVINRDQPQANLPVYLQAVDALIAWQLSSTPGLLPPYDEALLRRELELFPEWYLTRHKGVLIDAAMRKTLDNAFHQIIQNNLRSPSVFVHRDFMPRNLMAPHTEGGALGVLDFQDAVYGPITYDIASLMRDAFLSWDEDFCLDVTIRYWEKARQAGLPVDGDFGEFYRSVEWMGLQRHLKVAGIFARLTLRDGKPHYLADTPRFIHYIRATCERYRELKPLLRLIEKVEGIDAAGGYAFGRV